MGDAPIRAIQYGGCVSCSIGTRSHVLEAPEYESYEQEIIVDQSDDFANTQWEDIDTVTKWGVSKEASVMCHKCWLKTKEKTFMILKKNHPTWVEEPLQNTQHIKSFLSKWVSFEFGEVAPIDGQMNKLVNEVREAVRRAARGE